MIKQLLFKNLNLKYYRSGVFMTLAFLLINFLGTFWLKAQSFSNKPTYDKVFYAGMLVFSAGDLWLTHSLDAKPHVWKVSGLDDINSGTLYSHRALAADASAAGTLAVSGLLMVGLPKNQQWTYANTLVQNIWITGNLTQLVKILAQRSRPYTQGSTGYLGEKDDNYSFFSGHSAITAAAATTALYYGFNSQTPWIKYSSYGAGALCLTTAALRIAAGKHYPSDVITGLIVGTGISLLNIQLHKD